MAERLVPEGLSGPVEAGLLFPRPLSLHDLGLNDLCLLKEPLIPTSFMKIYESSTFVHYLKGVTKNRSKAFDDLRNTRRA